MSRVVCENLVTFISQPLKRKIDQKAIEKWASEFWKLSKHCPASKPQQHSQPFVMMFPPPNITGNLHLGHALTGAIQDAIVRQKQMQGFECLFIPGYDHAGIATQSIVEKLLWKQKQLTRQQLGRENFTNIANEWKEQKRDQMREQLNRLGLDLDNGREYFTMDDRSSLAVQTAFKKLFKDGIIYRSTKPIFWSENLQTTLSDIEVERINGSDTFIRTGEVVSKRPIPQWFIRAETLAVKAIEVVEKGLIEIIPPNYKNSWRSWLVGSGVEDWCISRQSWWGHRIPAYRLSSTADDHESWVVADNLIEARSLLNSNDDSEIVQDSDVLDTWFSSSLLPLTVSGWPDQHEFAMHCSQGRFPLQIMETGFDILTFWVSKMVMMSLALTGHVPFRLVLLHGMICDSDGKKMSKSRGNVIDPIDMIEGASLKELHNRTRESHNQGIIEDSRLQSILINQKQLFPFGIPQCGADGLRAYLLSQDVLEEVVKIQISQVDKIRRLSNKVWNVYRFIVNLRQEMRDGSHSDSLDIMRIDSTCLDETDREVLKALAECVEISHQVFNASYQFHICFNKLESFWVVHLSHNYIEKVKESIVAEKGTQQERERKIEVLFLSLVASIKLLHPFMPHLTEFLYQKLSFPNCSIDQPNLNANTILTKQPLSHLTFPKVEDWNKFLG